MEDFFKQLRRVNGERAIAWREGDTTEDPLFASNEFGGEAGEVQNVVKKLVREARGHKGSRDTVEHLADEIGDCIICLDHIARAYGIDIAQATARKFNKTSETVGFPQRMELEQTGFKKLLGDVFDLAIPVEQLLEAVQTLQEPTPEPEPTQPEPAPLHELESLIMQCWGVTEDVNLLFRHICDDRDFDEDRMANMLLGISQLYDIRFNNLFETYRGIIRDQPPR